MHRFRVTPTTKLGRLSVLLLAATAIVFAAAVIVSLVSGGGSDSIVDTSALYRFATGVALLTTGLGAMVSAAIALIRDRERSLLTWFALVAGMFATAFVLGDLVS